MRSSHLNGKKPLRSFKHANISNEAFNFYQSDSACIGITSPYILSWQIHETGKVLFSSLTFVSEVVLVKLGSVYS